MIPPRRFESSNGRSFSVGQGNALDGYPIRFKRRLAGRLYYRPESYPKAPWCASTRELYWRFAGDAPTGIGFDVAAFATAEECLARWARSADQILDWSEGLPVHGNYGVVQKLPAKREPSR